MNSMIEETEIISIGEGFLACTFPGANFHHREHLVTTVYLLWTFPQRNWRGHLPALIRRYNESQGGVNSDTAGYHETITMFYLDLVGKVLVLNPHLDLVQSCRQVLDGPASDKDLVLRYYSRELLFSSEARKRWVEPDLVPSQAVGLVKSEPGYLPEKAIAKARTTAKTRATATATAGRSTARFAKCANPSAQDDRV